MLVLSRQENQRIRFPGVGISVEILDIRGSKVRVGIDAPIEVRILRDELEELEESPSRPATQSQGLKTIRLPRDVRHELRNALHELSLMAHVYRKQSLKSGGGEVSQQLSPAQMCETIIERLNRLSEHHALSKDGVLATDHGDDLNCMGQALVVDDNDNERELMAGFLRMCGYEVTTAANGNEAIELLHKNPPPKVILLDMNMPDCDGQEFLGKVRSSDEWAAIQVFVVSGSKAKEYGLSKSDGYSKWFQKPLDPRCLVANLNKIETTAVA